MSSSDEDDSVVNIEYPHADESELIETADGKAINIKLNNYIL